MDKKTLQNTAKKHAPAQHKGRNALIVFTSGGALAAAAQLSTMLCMDMSDLDRDTAASVTAVTVILVIALLTGFGIYGRAAQKCRAGLFIPISGFANCLTSCAIKERTEGPIFGIGSSMFRLAGSALTCGIVAAFIFGMIRYLLFGT